MVDEYGGGGCELSARRRGVRGGRWTVRAVGLMAFALALAGAVHTQAASAYGRGFSWTPSRTEPYATCGHPKPGHAACLAVVVPPYSAGSLTESLKAADPASASPAYTGTGIGGGYGPADLRSAYNLPTGSQGTGQTVGIVDAYNDPNAESDLAVYRSQYGLPACTTANGCFKKVNQTGGTSSYPSNEPSWSVEMSLDVDMVSAACPNCHILLVEASSSSSANLYASEDEAATLGATEISNSWVGAEESGETSDDKYFDHPGVPITAGAGDDGYQVNYPASSQYVIAVGGTKLSQASNSRGWSETVWSEKPTQGTGSGCSAYEPKPSWQTDKGCTHKTNNDVAADASVETPLSVADSYELPTKFAERSTQPGWTLVGGTSAATPLVAGTMALASPYTRSLVGGHAFYLEAAAGGGVNDVVSGSDGTCTPPAEHEYLCTAEVGYDGPTGVGTPSGAPQAPPTVVTKAASSITQTSAVLNATVNPNGGSVSECKLEYGTTTSYGSSASCSPSPGSGESVVAVSASVTGLAANTTYHFRVSATNSGGTIKGSDETLKTTEAATSAPTAETKAASSVTQTAASLNGTVNPNGGSVSECKFEYGTTNSYGSSASCASLPGSGTSPVGVSASITGLGANATYHFRISATNAGGTSKGSDETFKTPPNAPTDVTKAASAVAQTAATLNATVNPNGGEVSKCEFEYGETNSYGKTASCASLPGSGTSAVEVSAAISGLTANATYHFRISATNAGGTSKGSDETFKTLPNAPTGVTKAASAVAQTAATLNATVNPNGGEVSECRFEYGETNSYGKTASCSSLPGSGTSAVAVTAAVSGLSANATYHFRISATNAGGTSKGSDETFKTSPNASTVVTRAATSVTQTTATLNATVNPNGGEVSKCEFEYGETNSYGKTASCTSLPGSGTSPVEVFAPISGLTANTTYHFRISATSASGTSKGADETFKALPNAPTPITKPASSVTQTTATLNATVNPNGGEVSECRFEYGETNSYGSTVSCSSPPGSGTSPVGVSAAISGLTANTTYHFRISATNATGTSKGSDETFKTSPNASTVVTRAATSVTQTTATLNATVNPNGGEVSKCEFEYGETKSYGKTASCTTLPGSGTSAVEVSAPITGLTANSTYHFRISATNASGTSKGADETFKTPAAGPPPAVVTKPASAVTETTATLNATVNPNGGEVSECKFEYGPTKSYGQSVPCSSLPEAAESPVAVSASLTGLTANAAYHYRISATNSSGTSSGKDQRFTTDPPTVVTEAATSITQTAATLNATVNPGAEELSECSFEYGTSTAYGQSAPCSSLPEAVEYPVAVSAAITGLTANTTYHYRISATNPSGPSKGADQEFKTSPSCTAEGFCANITHSEVGEFAEPSAVAVGSGGNIWVAGGHDQVLEFNSKHEYLSQFGSEGTGEGQFKGIGGIATNSAGDLYVSDSANDRVQEFSPSGAFLRQFGSQGLGAGQFYGPSGIAIDSSGNVWVLNTHGVLVQEFSPTGTYISGFGSAGWFEGGGAGIAFSGADLYVSEPGQGRVTEYSTTGSSLAVFDERGAGNGKSQLPSGIATDPTSGDLYVTDSGTDRVQEFSSAGSFITAFGSAGSGSGQFSDPKGVAVGSTGTVFVADSRNNRVEEWAPSP